MVIATGATPRHLPGVDGFEVSSAVDSVLLSDGTSVPARIVVVGIGVVPPTTWLAGSSFELRDGVVCDATLADRGSRRGVGSG